MKISKYDDLIIGNKLIHNKLVLYNSVRINIYYRYIHVNKILIIY